MHDGACLYTTMNFLRANGVIASVASLHCTPSQLALLALHVICMQYTSFGTVKIEFRMAKLCRTFMMPYSLLSNQAAAVCSAFCVLVSCPILEVRTVAPLHCWLASRTPTWTS